jgi:hypothetical protein
MWCSWCVLADQVRRFGAVGVAVLVSGGFMMAGGYLFHTEGWGTGSLVMLPSGPTISVAFALARRTERSRRGLIDAEPVGLARRVRAVVTILAGLPWPGGELPVLSQIGAFALTMLAGAVMALGGYAGAAWSWLLVGPIALLAGVTISAAFGLIVTGLQTSAPAQPAPR